MNQPAIKHALNVKRADDFAQWYQAVIAEAELAEESGVRGCMVIKPWGYGIWERIQIKRHITLSPEVRQLLTKAAERLGLSARSYFRV
ncbi:MAG: hypothetical protein ACKOVA_08650, partial [Novosphingobium sp.]